jgi:hypothetical protein
MSEKTELQNKVDFLCDNLGIKYYHIENNQRQQKYRKSKYKKYKGMPDHLIFCKKGLVIFEYKLEYNELQDKQIEWRDYLLGRGYNWYEIKDINEAIEIIKKCENIS